MNSVDSNLKRRAFLQQSTMGFGALALSTLLDPSLLLGTEKKQIKSLGVLQPLHFPAKCERVIFLCMAGGPSQLETFDYKPTLAKMHGKPMPTSYTKGQQIAQLQGKKLNCFGPQHPFKKWGKSGQEISTVLPHIGSIADEICIIRSMQTSQINHDPAHTVMNTGNSILGRPSMGSWINYALGSQSDDLPGFVVMTSVGGGQSQPIAARQWHSGFLKSKYQGVQFQSSGDPVLYLKNPKGVTQKQQNQLIDMIKDLNSIGNRKLKDPEIDTSISQLELTAKMQLSVPKLMDLSKEPASIKKMYGKGTFASNCLLARRLAEKGVRFVQLYHRGWDHHGGIKKGIKTTAGYIDQATAALIKDLKQKGMLDTTLVIWTGEFGRTPMAQGSGRDHHIKAFSMWMVGGGIKPGISYGKTDELGYNAVEDVVQIRDLHATILKLLGINHQKLTVKFQGLDQRLTGVEKAEPIKKIIS